MLCGNVLGQVSKNSKPTNNMEKRNNKFKERHGCVSAWLIFIIIVNFIIILFNVFSSPVVTKSLLHYPSKLVMVSYTAIAALNILFIVMILKWKKWAFWGFVIIGFWGAILNFFVTVNFFTSTVGLLGIVILYGILQIKKDKISAWSNLE